MSFIVLVRHKTKKIESNMTVYFKCLYCFSFFEGDPTHLGPCAICGKAEGFSPVSRDDAEKMLAQMEHNPASTFIPNGDQERWIALTGNHIPGVKPRTKVLSAPNKIGKTAVTIVKLVNLIYGKQSPWFDYPMYNEPWPFPKICWIASWESALKEAVIPEMLKWFPKGRFTPTKEGKHFQYHWITDTGWHIYVKSYDQGTTAFESTLVGLVILSEPPPEAIYDALPARLTQGGMILMEQTPVPRMNPAWIYDILEEEGKAEFLYSDMGLEVNCKEHGIRGHLTHLNIKETVESYSWLERYARETGKPMNLSGAVFKRFNPDWNVVPPRPLAAEEQIWMVCDPHDRKPPFMTWWAINQALDIRLVYEFPIYRDNQGYEKITGTSLMISDFAEAIRNIEQRQGYTHRIIRRIMDPFFGSKEYSNTKYSVIKTYNDSLRSLNGNEMLFILGARQEVAYGEDLMQKALNYQIRTDDTAGFKPKMTYEIHCMNGIRATKRYSHVDAAKVRDDQEISPGKKRTERWKHFIDNTRYLLAANIYYDYDRAGGVIRDPFKEQRNIFGRIEQKRTTQNWITS